MGTPQIQPNLKETYLAVIGNAVGSRMFRNFYLTVDGKVVDAIRDGVVACAFFASNILHMFVAPRWISEPHLTVKSTVKDMKAHGWYVITEPRIGAVIIWGPDKSAESKLIHGTLSESHIGFYTGHGKAISNYYKTGIIEEHHWTFGTNADDSPVRDVREILWHDALGK